MDVLMSFQKLSVPIFGGLQLSDGRDTTVDGKNVLPDHDRQLWLECPLRPLSDGTLMGLRSSMKSGSWWIA